MKIQDIQFRELPDGGRHRAQAIITEIQHLEPGQQPDLFGQVAQQLGTRWIRFQVPKARGLGCVATFRIAHPPDRANFVFDAKPKPDSSLAATVWKRRSLESAQIRGDRAFPPRVVPRAPARRVRTLAHGTHPARSRQPTIGPWIREHVDVGQHPGDGGGQ